ncbi:bacteriocin immunity protein [Carnobacterium inhibens]|uniref:bacteriocin immunity protein n=1 Tax=Carnobacterium inhibens TaxID=147709 RepID=UPI00068D5FB7|nr:bacteriocin immunity protein [Carnobacterium inhibens]
MANQSKEYVHNLYNSISHSDLTNVEDLKEVLLNVYSTLDDPQENVSLINRLVNYIYLTAITEKIKFNEEQQNLISKLNDIG